MGGEKLRKKRKYNNPLGSPPRGRGKDGSPPPAPVRPGITPAWAGKRVMFHRPFLCLRDHPRVGGEKLHKLVLFLPAEGSPPRGRGKAFWTIKVLAISGITPAWAGKSDMLCCSFFLGKDHPRVGGEKLASGAAKAGAWGSPPRGRGKVILHPIHCPHGRITPAWAGKS